MIARLLLWGLILLGRPPSAFDKCDPDEKRPLISVAERERLGVRQKDWPGVVDPEVYARLDALAKRFEELKAVLHQKQGRDEYASMAMFATDFAGTVYVQVLLQPNKNVTEIQRRVLH